MEVMTSVDSRFFMLNVLDKEVGGYDYNYEPYIAAILIL